MDRLKTFERLVRDHEAMLVAYVLGLVADRDLAEEVAQDAFVSAYEHLDQLRDDAAFAPWLRTIARHQAFAALRRRRREVSIDPQAIAGMEAVFGRLDVADAAAEGQERWEDRAAVVVRCYGQLPEGLAAVADAHYRRDLRTDAIAGLLAISRAAVLKRLERARTALRDCIGRHLRVHQGEPR